MTDRIFVGVISDTHGLLRPEAVDKLRGSDYIIHAGDIGDPEVLDGLREIAPVTAVRGNIDRNPWALMLPETAILDLPGAPTHVIHDIAALHLDPAAAGFRIIVSGHSHQPGWHERGGVLYVNPGSAGPRRFSLPVSVGRLIIEATNISVELHELSVVRRKATKATTG